MIIEHWCSMQIYSWKLTFNIFKWIYDSWKKLYSLVNVTFTVRFSLTIFSIKVFVNDGMSTWLRCQTSEEIEEELEDSAGHFFFNTRGLAFMRKMMTFHPTWRTLIKADYTRIQFSRSNDGHELRCELRIDIRFWTDFCTHHEIQMNLF